MAVQMKLAVQFLLNRSTSKPSFLLRRGLDDIAAQAEEREKP